MPHVAPHVLDPIIIKLSPEDITFALDIADKRTTQSLNFTESGPIHQTLEEKILLDKVGAYAEVAICRFYDESPHDQTQPWCGRPGHLPDLYFGKTSVAVKGSARWMPPIRLFMPVLDPSDIAYLVSVDLVKGRCGVQGWIERDELLDYRPVQDHGRTVRIVPVERLRSAAFS